MIFSSRLRKPLLSRGALACVLAAAAIVVPTAGCEASGQVEGGEPFDSGTVTTVVTTTDDGGTTTHQAISCGGADAGSGSTYTDLYRDFFGPTSTSSCAGSVGSCHGEASGAGALGSGGFVCGSSQDDCFAGMNVTTADLLATSDTSHPGNSGLEVALRKATASGINNMPLQPPNTCVFTDDDIARISAWIASGAPNN